MAPQATILRAPAFAAQVFERAPTLIAPWLAAGSVTLLFGPPSAGKTHLTVSLACALAHGEPVWGVFPTQESRVLIVQADMNTALYQERILPNAERLGENVAILSTDAMPLDICAFKPSDALVRAVRDFDPHIIFVDTLRKTHMLDENDSNAADRVYTAWRSLFPGAALVFLHHSRKIATDAKGNDAIIREAFRGSGAWAASADTIIMQKRVRRANNPAWMTRVHWVRTRSCQEPTAMLLRLNESLLLEPMVENPAERALLDWVAANPQSRRPEAIKWMMDANGLNISQATAYRTWDRVMKGDG